MAACDKATAWLAVLLVMLASAMQWVAGQSTAPWHSRTALRRRSSSFERFGGLRRDAPPLSSAAAAASNGVNGSTREAPQAVRAIGPTVIQRSPECQFCHCKKVYLDVGSNIGVQVRKLYEPSRFPGAPVHKFFNKYFGEDRSQVCTVGFEPNPRWTGELMEIQDTYRMMGYNVKFMTRTAVVADEGGVMGLHLDAVKSDYKSTGSSLISNTRTQRQQLESTPVQTINLVRFIHDHLDPSATIVMKLDIEGAEFTVFPQMLLKGVLCQYLDLVFVEWHDFKRMFQDTLGQGMQPGPFQERPSEGWKSTHIMRFVQAMINADPTCNLELSNLDDETFHDMSLDKLPLPPLKMDVP